MSHDDCALSERRSFGGGKIEIEFYSGQDLDRLYRSLMHGSEATTASVIV